MLACAIAIAVASVSSLCSAQSSDPLMTVVESPRIEDIKQPLQRVAFGSCNDQSFPQPMWTNISAHEPELWIWMGDNVWRTSVAGMVGGSTGRFTFVSLVLCGQIYADVKELGEPRPLPIPPRKMFVEATREELIRRYKYDF